MFSAIAGSYDLNNRLHSLGRDQAWRRNAVKLCAVQPSDDVLDVACGTGDLAMAFAQAGPRSVTAVDFSEQMLDRARDKQQRAKTDALEIEYRTADAMALPFADESFDIVSIAFGLRNVAEPMSALREFQRVLRAGGRLVVLEFSEPKQPVLRWFSNLYCRRIMPITATLIARDRTGAYRYLPKSVETFASPEQLERELREAGFAEVEQHPQTFGICTATIGRVMSDGF